MLIYRPTDVTPTEELLDWNKTNYSRLHLELLNVTHKKTALSYFTFCLNA